jgi:outer membrane receptor protein involved in Fe transport
MIAPPIPDAAGTGLYGQRVVVGTTAGNQIAVGYNPCQNVAITNGAKLYGQFVSSFSYRLQLPKEVDLTFTVDNVLDADPKFSRDTLNYDSGSSVSPLGRTYQVSVRKTF